MKLDFRFLRLIPECDARIAEQMDTLEDRGEGVSIQTTLAFLGEVGTDVEKFPSAEHFAPWLGLCPDNRITGGRTHAALTRKVNNRLATALRMAAQSLHRSNSGLGDWFRRLKSKLGTKAEQLGFALTPVGGEVS